MGFDDLSLPSFFPDLSLEETFFDDLFENDLVCTSFRSDKDSIHFLHECDAELQSSQDAREPLFLETTLQNPSPDAQFKPTWTDLNLTPALLDHSYFQSKNVTHDEKK